MRKYILGAGAALAFAAGEGGAQTPAPIVPLQSSGPVVPPPVTGPVVTGAPVVPVGDPYLGPVVTSGGGGGSAARMYAEGSFLMFWVDSTTIPIPLATGGTSLGILGQPGTTVLIGGNTIDYGEIPGFKLMVGGFLGDCALGFEVGGFYLSPVSDTISVGSNTSGFIARPFFDPTTRRENARLVAVPGSLAGGVAVDQSFEAYGFETNPFWRIVQGEAVTMDLITGFRYFRNDEVLNIFEGTNLQPGGVSTFNGLGVQAPGTILTHDRFGARNTFYGGNLGTRLSFGGGGFFVDVTGKVGIGAVDQVVSVDGTTRLQRGGGVVSPVTTPGGFLTAGTNLGERKETRFAVLPEGDVKVGYRFTEWLNVFTGYTVMYLSSAVRPAEQLSRTIPANSIATFPTYTGVFTPQRTTEVIESDLWIHGFNFGITISY